MKWKTVIFWIVALAALWCYFFYYASYTFDAQEEMQLFIPSWDTVWAELGKSGGAVRLMGMATIQYFPVSSFAALANALALTLAGVGVFLLLQLLAPRGYHLWLALFLPLCLLRIHIRLEYLIDGTYAFVIVLLTAWAVLRTCRERFHLPLGMAGALLVYWMAGQAVAVYGVVFFLFSFMPVRQAWRGLSVLAVSACLAFIGWRFAIQQPITNGFHETDYFQTLLQPDAYIYHVWLRLTATLVVICIVAYALRRISFESKWRTRTVHTVLVACTFLFGWMSMPDGNDMQNRMMDSLNYLVKRQRWDTILSMHQGREQISMVNLNYVNMALAQKGQLGNRLFSYSQHGPLGLMASYNLTYYISTVLSDVYYTIGDIATTESYAVEAMTLARRGGGSPRAMQRLVQTSLLRGDMPLASKYISILSQMPMYRQWAKRYETYLSHPEALKDETEVAARRPGLQADDNLLSFMPTDTLLTTHLADPASGRTAYEYLGCHFMLDKDTARMRQLLIDTATDPAWQPMPVHFQEAAVMLFEDSPELLASMPVTAEVKQRYASFCQQMRSSGSTGRMALNREFGNTFWHYYYFNSFNHG